MPPLQNNGSALTREKKQGIAVSVIVHLLFALFLVLASFRVRPALPVEVEEGLLVNFGFDDAGQGLFEPPPPVPEVVPAPPASAESEKDDAILTQDFEEAPEVRKKEPSAEELKRQEEARLAELKRREEAAAERRRIEQENAERLRREEEERRLNQIKDRTRTALSNAGNAGTSEGIAGGQGNQGTVTGTPGAPDYGQGGGTGSQPVSYRLGDRKSIALPKPKYDHQDEGIVVVEITVDRQGNVTKAVPGVKGSTTLDEYFLKAARDAAMQAKFDRSDEAPLLQKGTITYIFKLN